MKYFRRIFFVMLGAAIVLGAALVAMLVVSSHRADLYNGRLKVAFNAATLNYVSGDPARTVVVTYNGEERELDPDQYRVLSFYMRLGATGALFPRTTHAEKLTVVICQTDTADIYCVSEDEAYIVFRSAGETMKIMIRGDGLWNDLVTAATKRAKSSMPAK